MDSCRTSDLLPQNSSPTCINLEEMDEQRRRWWWERWGGSYLMDQRELIWKEGTEYLQSKMSTQIVQIRRTVRKYVSKRIFRVREDISCFGQHPKLFEMEVVNKVWVLITSDRTIPITGIILSVLCACKHAQNLAGYFSNTLSLLPPFKKDTNRIFK